MSLSTNFPTIKPTLLLDFANTKQLDPRITFTRASTATYYDGKTTAKAEENLLTYSQDFDNAIWTKFGCTITANGTTAPDGTTTADALVESVGGTFHYLDFSNSALVASGTTVAVSVYLKANGRTWAHVNLGTGQSAYFDLTNGVVGTTNGTLLGTAITSVGNGWYRCSVTAVTASATGRIQVYAASANGTASYSGDGTSGLFVWGAQFEARSSVTAYTATTSAPITNYIPALQTAASGVARFDNNPTTGESLGLLIEEQRTNLLLNSGAIATGGSSGLWNSYYGASFDASVSVAPDGTLTASSMYPTTGGGGTGYGAYYHAGVAATSGVAYTLTVYAKSGGLTKVGLGFSTAGAAQNAVFNLATGAVDSGTGAITAVGNGWYRCSITVTAASTGTYYPVISFSPQQTGGSGNKFANVFVWGSQCEAGAFATSYIATTSAQVTRSADAASMTGTNFSSWFNAGAGTLYSEAYVSPNSGVCYGATISDNTASNAINIGQYNGRNNLGYIKTSGVDQALLSSNATQATGSYLKQAMAFAYNDAADSPNGAAVATDTSVVLPSVNRLDIGGWAAVSTVTLNGTIKKIAYYPARVTNAQLQALTS